MDFCFINFYFNSSKMHIWLDMSASYSKVLEKFGAYISSFFSNQDYNFLSAYVIARNQYVRGLVALSKLYSYHNLYTDHKTYHLLPTSRQWVFFNDNNNQNVSVTIQSCLVRLFYLTLLYHFTTLCRNKTNCWNKLLILSCNLTWRKDIQR